MFQRAEDKRHVMNVGRCVHPAVIGLGRNRHRVTFIDSGPVPTEHGHSVCRVVAEMNLDAVVMTMRRDVTFVTGEPRQVPRVMIAIDKRYNRDAEARHNESGLLGRVCVLRHVNAAFTADAFHNVAKPDGNLPRHLAVCCRAFGPQRVEDSLDAAVIPVERGDHRAKVAGNRFHRLAGEIFERFDRPSAVKPGEVIRRRAFGESDSGRVKRPDDVQPESVAVETGQRDGLVVDSGRVSILFVAELCPFQGPLVVRMHP